MIFISVILFVLGMCIQLAGMLGYGWSYTLGGAAVTIIGGVLWGLTPPKGKAG